MTLGVAVKDGEPFYFGPPDKSLFGCYHPPAPGASRNCGLLLCAPTGQEYIRAHRAFRQLAIRLSKVGFPVLRFDYYGCGDSTGADDEGDLFQWLDDISTATDELKRRSRASRLCLIGLRLGSTLALLAGASRGDIASVALWEPVFNGQTYVQELATQHRDVLWRYFARPVNGAPGTAPTELLGFPLTNSMLADLERLDLLMLDQKPATHLLILENGAEPAAGRLSEHLVSLGAQVTHQRVPSPKIWAEDPDKALVPHQVLQAIVSWVSEVNP